MDKVTQLIDALANLARALQWPLVAAILAAFFGDEIKLVIGRLSHIKTPVGEAEFFETKNDQLSALGQSSTVPESALQHRESEKKADDESAVSENELDKDPPKIQSFEAEILTPAEARIFQTMARSPREAFLEFYLELEKSIGNLASLVVEYDDVDSHREKYPSLARRTIALVDSEILDTKVGEMIRGFTEIRNTVAHARPADDLELSRTIAIGMQVIRQIDELYENELVRIGDMAADQWAERLSDR